MASTIMNRRPRRRSPGAMVAVRLGALSGGVLLEVADAGPGMSAEDAARAFDRFHRAAEQSNGGAEERAASNGGGGGSGLGL